MTSYIYSLIDKFKAGLAITAFVLLGGLIAGGPLSVYYQWQLSNAAKAIERVTKEKDRQINAATAQSARLTEIIEKRLPPIVEQQKQNAEQLEQLTATVDDTTTKAQRAANTANQAASRAGQAVRKSREPVGSLRMAPSKPTKPRCRGKDVFGDPCK